MLDTNATYVLIEYFFKKITKVKEKPQAAGNQKRKEKGFRYQKI